MDNNCKKIYHKDPNFTRIAIECFVYHKSIFMKKCLELNTLKYDLKRWHDSNDTFYVSLSWKGLIMKQGVPNVQSSCIGILDEIHAVWSSLFFQIPSCQRQMTCQASYLHIYKKKFKQSQLQFWQQILHVMHFECNFDINMMFDTIQGVPKIVLFQRKYWHFKKMFTSFFMSFNLAYIYMYI